MEGSGSRSPTSTFCPGTIRWVPPRVCAQSQRGYLGFLLRRGSPPGFEPRAALSVPAPLAPGLRGCSSTLPLCWPPCLMLDGCRHCSLHAPEGSGGGSAAACAAFLSGLSLRPLAPAVECGYAPPERTALAGSVRLLCCTVVAPALLCTCAASRGACQCKRTRASLFRARARICSPRRDGSSSGRQIFQKLSSANSPRRALWLLASCIPVFCFARVRPDAAAGLPKRVSALGAAPLHRSPFLQLCCSLLCAPACPAVSSGCPCRGPRPIPGASCRAAGCRDSPRSGAPALPL